MTPIPPVDAATIGVRAQTNGLATLLLLADGRLPVGAHANSGGVEWASRVDDLSDPGTLEAWMRARLGTVGTVDAAFAVSTLAHVRADKQLVTLDSELAARVVGERAQLVSRQLGRQFSRAARRVWLHPPERNETPADGQFAPIALGITAGLLQLHPREVAGVVLHHYVAAAGTAAVRLLGLDPLEIAALQARLSDDIDRIATSADEWACADPANLPATTSPLAESFAEQHGQWSNRLFLA